MPKKAAKNKSVLKKKVKVQPALPKTPATKFPGFTTNVEVKIVADDKKFIPQYKTSNAACADLVAKLEETIRLPSRASAVIDCGFSMELPEGYKALIVPRSGLAKKGLIIPNSPGTIHPDYRGRVQVLLQNVGREIVMIEPEQIFAQMSLEPIYKFEWEEVDTLPETDRGEGGFGYTDTTEGVNYE